MKNLFIPTILLLCSVYIGFAQEKNSNYSLKKDFTNLTTSFVNNNFIEEESGNDSSSSTTKTNDAENMEELKKEYSVKLTNIKINTPASEFSPMLLDGTLIYAGTGKGRASVRKNGKKNKEAMADIFKVILENHKKAGKIKQLSRRINTRNHEATVSFSPNRNTVYYTKKGKRINKLGNRNLKIYKSIKVNGKWDWGYKLPFCSKEYSIGHPSVSPDGKNLYFVSDMPGGHGETDIYVVDIKADGTYSKPRNLGPEVNSPNAESFPFITENKLYFSSNRSKGEGGLDLYESNIHKGKFTKALNMGEPFNSNKDDFGFIIGKDYRSGYFSSNRNGGKGGDDIYSFDLSKKDYIEGVVEAAKSSTVIAGVEVRLLNQENKIIDRVFTNASGVYRFKNLKENGKYLIEFEKDDYLAIRLATELKPDSNRNFKIALTNVADAPEFKSTIVEPNTEMIADGNNKNSANASNTKENIFEVAHKESEKEIGNQSNTSYQNRNATIEGTSKDLNLNLAVSPIYYEYNQSVLSEESEMSLNTVIDIIKANPTWKIRIESHTDARGGNEFNKKLSEKRSRSVKEYLIAYGLKESNIAKTIGYGEEKPAEVCDNNDSCNEQTHKLNRRTDIILIKK